MPKIPEFTGGPNIGPRSIVGVDAGGGGSEGSAIANFGKTFSNVVGRVAADIERTNNELNYQELRTELQRMVKSSAEDLSERKEGQAEDGSDVVENAKKAFETANSEVMKKARSGAVKRRLASFSKDLGMAFEEDASNIAQSRYKGFIKEKTLDLSRNEAAQVLDNPEYLESAMKNFSTHLSNLDVAMSADEAKVFKKNHKATLRSALEKHYLETDDGANLEELQRAISGTSDNQSANELYSDMDALSKKTEMSRIEDRIKRRDYTTARDVTEAAADLKARMVMGESATPGEFNALISKVNRLKIEDRDKVKIVDSLKGQQLAARAISGVKEGAMSKLKSMMDNPYSYIKDSKISARIKQEAGEQLRRAANARMKSLVNDSAGTLLSEDGSLQTKLDAAVKSEGGFYDFAFSDFPETEEGKAERAQAINKFRDYRKAMRAKHDSMGLPYTPVSKAQAMQIASNLQSMKVKDRVAYIGSITEAFGEDAPQLGAFLRSSLNKNLGQKVSAMLGTASLSDSAKMSMLNNYDNQVLDDKKQYESLLGSVEDAEYTSVKDIEKAVDSEFSKISSYFIGSNGGEAMQASLMDAVKLEAKRLNLDGVDNPVEAAYRNIIESSFEQIEVGDSVVLRTRNTLGGKAKAPVEDVQEVLGAAIEPDNLKGVNLMVPEPFKESIRTGKVKLTDFSDRLGATATDIMRSAKSPKDLSDEDIEQLFRLHVSRNGRWKDDGTGTGYKLMIDMGTGPLGEVLQLDGVDNNTARPFMIKDSQIQEYGEGSLGVDLPSKDVPFVQSTIKYISNSMKKMKERRSLIRGFQ